MKLIILLFLFFNACKQEIIQETIIEESKKIVSNKRYEVKILEPPIIFSDVSAMSGQAGQWPLLFIQQNNGDINADNNLYDRPERLLRLGLGLSLQFHKLNENEDKEWFEAGSLKILYDGNLLKVEHNPIIQENFVSSFDFKYYKEFLNCNISNKEGLSCIVDCTGSVSNKCLKKYIWSNQQNPIVEINITSNPGVYAMTKNGTLIFSTRQRAEISDTIALHPNIKFIKNSDGRYFINHGSNAACMQSENLDIYCSDLYNSESSPSLTKVINLDFKAERTAFSGGHFCFLSGNGDVFCIGDNTCGQITGRHDQELIFKKPKKIEFLNYPAKEVFVYSGGTCVLLTSNQVQCFGLGASVIRKRLFPDEKYRRSFSWLNGFRPEDVCKGGAEDGV